ncbi:CDP-alcohol phosphatidyltransferase family protein [Blautia liquoris]|jgi:CDP-diacylglycerol--serine O-phosphatidyltransferase|uniref:CDP-alcohol phosphatidyltransferase family protein n=1 Tax=Blautia liquoris TaxID=2779518 RepID=A0A7M2RKM6_9FIRM|nr:CDP-alcohol phosphatidyltransferase family protein [Blautia liquoris]QOV20839.1 CDP-alcohol phosphatidyltransferase family protein [Blautia liquoris]
MIGFYDYTVILTYISFASSISGIFCAITGHFRWAIFCLAFSGLCDMFDGKIARTKKDRTREEKSFGIQIDSLCDVVCFGAFPIVLCYSLGMKHIYSMIILIFYGLAGVIRLGFFNVLAEEDDAAKKDVKPCYHGLPITSMAVALPLAYLLSPLLHGFFIIVLHIMVLVIAILFVTDFKFRKPTNKELSLIVGIVAIAVLGVLFRWDRRVGL